MVTVFLEDSVYTCHLASLTAKKVDAKWPSCCQSSKQCCFSWKFSVINII